VNLWYDLVTRSSRGFVELFSSSIQRRELR
jgi:hypothetical protein